ncbi:MFS transporter [Curtobacterium sp. BRB10]|uniref:MFS transporter n=1 Tax=Curtobacterium sp. BRB10 TaxID=2962579 RepID=UPI00288125F6|nr:MFS transporter [Curtobacterium sp. BRB10]MDT0234834.1 MFS transporter [Curtobacterium sp. BRB10]
MTSTTTTPKTGGLVFTLAFAGISASIMQTMVTPLIPQLPRIFDTSSSNTAWVVTVTLLAAAVAVPIAGRLGDIVGKRQMIIACAVPLIIGSIICALAPSVLVMIIGRGMQGLGMGVVPLGVALLRDVVPPEKLSSSIALVSATMGIGGAIGLPIASAVAEYADWRVLFWGAAGLAAVAATFVFFKVPSVPSQAKGQRVDLVGAIGLAAGLVSLLLAVSKGATWGWTSVTTITLFVAAVVLFAVWGWWELRTRDPLVDLRTTARPRVLMTNIASVFIGFGMYASMLVIPQVLQFPTQTGYGLGQSLLQAGLWMAPSGVMMMIVSPLGAKLTVARGAKTTLVTGALVIAVGYAASLGLMGTTWGLMIVGMIVNSGVGLAYGAMPTLIMSAVPRSETAAANGFNTLMRSLGTTIGAAVIGVILSQVTTDFGGTAIASENGFRIALIAGGGITLVAAVLAAVIPAVRTKAAEPSQAPVVDVSTGSVGIPEPAGR